VPRAIAAPVLTASAFAAALAFSSVTWSACSTSQTTAHHATATVISTAAAKARSTRRRSAAPGTDVVMIVAGTACACTSLLGSTSHLLGAAW
jgi:hypothetical protein